MTWNQQRSQAARERIRQAIADLLDKGTLPANATARFHALTGYGIGGGCLYRHRDLWHPNHLFDFDTNAQSNEKISDALMDFSLDRAEGAPSEGNPKSLLAQNDGNHPTSRDVTDFLRGDRSSTDGNSPPDQEVSGLANQDSPISPLEQPEAGVRYVQQILFKIQEQRQADREQVKQRPLREQQPRQEEVRAAQVQRMQQYWDSGDPILMAEAQRWAVANPGVLDIPATSDQRQEGESDGSPSLPMGKALLRQTEGSARIEVASESRESEVTGLINAEGLEVADFSDVLAQISVHRQRIGWTPTQVQEALLQRFGKTNQALLTDSELMEWLSWLREQRRSPG